MIFEGALEHLEADHFVFCRPICEGEFDGVEEGVLTYWIDADEYDIPELFASDPNTRLVAILGLSQSLVQMFGM